MAGVIEKNVSPTLLGWGITVIGTSAIPVVTQKDGSAWPPLTPNKNYPQPKRGLKLRAHRSNAGYIYIGGDASVTPDNAPATDGYYLAAGDSIDLPIEEVDKVYAIASVASQKLHWLLY